MADREPKPQKLCKRQAEGGLAHARTYTHARARTCFAGLLRCWPCLAPPRLRYKPGEPGFLTLEGGRGVRTERGPGVFSLSGLQSCRLGWASEAWQWGRPRPAGACCGRALCASRAPRAGRRGTEGQTGLGTQWKGLGLTGQVSLGASRQDLSLSATK